LYSFGRRMEQPFDGLHSQLTGMMIATFSATRQAMPIHRADGWEGVCRSCYSIQVTNAFTAT
jgi:hypothetical protein